MGFILGWLLGSAMTDKIINVERLREPAILWLDRFDLFFIGMAALIFWMFHDADCHPHELRPEETVHNVDVNTAVGAVFFAVVFFLTVLHSAEFR